MTTIAERAVALAEEIWESDSNLERAGRHVYCIILVLGVSHLANSIDGLPGVEATFADGSAVTVANTGQVCVKSA